MKRLTATSTRASSDGFTLVELTLVVLIVGILLSLIGPRLATLTEARLDSGARRIAAMITYLHDEAALRGRIYKLTLDIDRNSYTVEVQAPFADGKAAKGFVERWDAYAQSADLPAGVILEQVTTASAVLTSGTSEVYFLPEDSLENVRIMLTADDGRSVELDVNGTTGRVDILPVGAGA